MKPGEILVTHGYTHRGYEYPLIKFVIISESDIFGKEKKKKKKRKSFEGQKIESFNELSVGDYVVHENHGLGIYKGIEKVEVDRVTKDYMKIEYSGGSNLYILATQLDVIQKYADSDAKKPKLNKLGTQEWNKTKTRVRSAVKDIAKDLVELYAVRQAREGFIYGPDTVWQKEFEEMFPFEETEDQLLAIEAAKRIWRALRSWIALSAEMWDTVKRKLPSGRHLKRRRKVNRWYIWCLPQFWRSSIIIHLFRE